MSWSFDDSLATDRDNVRLLIGDTDNTDQQFSDETIDALLAAQTVYDTASRLVSNLIAKYARKAQMSMGSLSISYNQLVENYKSLLAVIQGQASKRRSFLVYGGGLSKTDKELVQSDTDRVKPSFTRNLHRVPGMADLNQDAEVDWTEEL